MSQTPDMDGTEAQPVQEQPAKPCLHSDATFRGLTLADIRLLTGAAMAVLCYIRLNSNFLIGLVAPVVFAFLILAKTGQCKNPVIREITATSIKIIRLLALVQIGLSVLGAILGAAAATLSIGGLLNILN